MMPTPPNFPCVSIVSCSKAFLGMSTVCGSSLAMMPFSALADHVVGLHLGLVDIHRLEVEQAARQGLERLIARID